MKADSVPEVDYVMSFEELGAFMVAYDIDVANCPEKPLNARVTKFGRGFAQAGGVRAAVVNTAGDGFTTTAVEGLDKKNQALLKAMVKKPEAQFVEVMACDGGCINGPCSLAPLPSQNAKSKKYWTNNKTSPENHSPGFLFHSNKDFLFSAFKIRHSLFRNAHLP